MKTISPFGMLNGFTFCIFVSKHTPHDRKRLEGKFAHRHFDTKTHKLEDDAKMCSTEAETATIHLVVWCVSSRQTRHRQMPRYAASTVLKTSRAT